MPPKQKITKEILLKQAFKIVQEKGIDAVTARSVAKAAGCSIQPVFSQFSTMEELRQETFDYACKIFMKEVLAYEEYPDFFQRVTLWVIDLARNKPNLFHLLYLSDSYQSNSLIHVMLDFESNQRIVSKMTKLYELDREICKDILMRSFLLLHGIAAMICTNHMSFSDEQIKTIMKETVSDMVKGAKR